MKTILLTGATDGIGLETAKMMIKKNHTLLLHGRSEVKLAQAKADLQEIDPTCNVHTLIADFADLQQVKAMANEIKMRFQSISAIVNNAGIFVVSESDAITGDGYDIRFSVNTIAPYIITKTLLSNLNSDSRVINVSSAAQAPFSIAAVKQGFRTEDSEAYAQSKLALIMWSLDMAKDHPPGPIIISINPKSFLGTKMVKEAYGQEGYDLRIGADIFCKAAFSDEFSAANGLYFDNDYGTFSNPHPFAFNENARLELMEFLDSLV